MFSTAVQGFLATKTSMASSWPVSFLSSDSVPTYIGAVAGLVVLTVRPHFAAQLLRPRSHCGGADNFSMCACASTVLPGTHWRGILDLSSHVSQIFMPPITASLGIFI